MLAYDVDGDLEIIVWAGRGGRLFGWHHDGTEIVDGDQNPATDGIIIRIYDVSYNYGSPAVGNLDADPELEIVFPVNLSGNNSGGVYAVNIDGNLVTEHCLITAAFVVVLSIYGYFFLKAREIAG